MHSASWLIIWLKHTVSLISFFLSFKTDLSKKQQLNRCPWINVEYSSDWLVSLLFAVVFLNTNFHHEVLWLFSQGFLQENM